MAALLAALAPAANRHTVAARAALALIAEGLVNLRSIGQLARGFLNASSS